MSYTEHHYGKLRKISFPEEGDNGGTCLEEMLEELMLTKLKENNETV